MKKLELRCSGLPLAFRCPGSVREASLPINETGEAADLGRAAHELLAQLVTTDRIPWDDLPAVAKRYQVDAEELRVLMHLGAQLWNAVKESCPNPLTEVELMHHLGPATLTGHADIYSRTGTEAFIPDWKTGRADSDYSEQLKGYAALALLEDVELTKATAAVLWVRDGTYEQYTMDRAGVWEWMRRVESEIIQWDGTYRPGKHCEYCPRAHECPARAALVRSAVAAITGQDVGEVVAAMAPEQVVQLSEMADIARSQVERVKAAIKKRVEQQGDVTALGKVITLAVEQRRKLKPVEAFAVLEERGFGDAEWAQVIDMSVSAAEKIIATKAGKGKGAAAVRELKAALEAAEAVETETVTRLVTRRA